jgi:hypothetical protein
MSSNKTFWLVDPESNAITVEFQSKSPRDAALKAATRNERQIHLVDAASGKIHIFRGERVPLRGSEENEYTRSRKIYAKPQVSKMAYRNLGQSVRKSELERVCAVVRELVE